MAEALTQQEHHRRYPPAPSKVMCFVGDDATSCCSSGMSEAPADLASASTQVQSLSCPRANDARH